MVGTTHKPPEETAAQPAPQVKKKGIIATKIEEHKEKKAKKKAVKEAEKIPEVADPIKVNEVEKHTKAFLGEAIEALEKNADAKDVAGILKTLHERMRSEMDDMTREALSRIMLKIAARRPDALAILQGEAAAGKKPATEILNVLTSHKEGITPEKLKLFGNPKNKKSKLDADEMMRVVGVLEEKYLGKDLPLVKTAEMLGLDLSKIPALSKTGILVELHARRLATGADIEQLGVAVYDSIITKLRNAGYEDFAEPIAKMLEKGVSEATLDDVLLKAMQSKEMEKILKSAYDEKTAANIMKQVRAVENLDELLKISEKLPHDRFYGKNVNALKELIGVDFEALKILEKSQFEFSNAVVEVVQKRGVEYGPTWAKIGAKIKKGFFGGLKFGGEILMVSPGIRLIEQFGKEGTPWGRLKAGGRLAGQALIYAGIIVGLYILSKHYKGLKKEEMKEKFKEEYPGFYKAFTKFNPEFQSKLLDFYMSEEGLYAIGEIIGYFPKEVPKPFDMEDVMKMLNPEKGWFFYPGKGEKVLEELVNAVPYTTWATKKKWAEELLGLKEKKSISQIVDSKTSEWKNKGYLMTEGQFFIAATCEVDLKLDEKTTKYYMDNPLVFIAMWNEIKKGNFPRSLMGDVELVGSHVESLPGMGVGIPWVPTEKPSLAPVEPFAGGSIMDVLDQYATFEPKLKGQFKSLLKKYNEDEVARARLNSFILGDNEAVYGNIAALAWDVVSGKVKSVEDVKKGVISGKSKGKEYWYWVGEKYLMVAAPNMAQDKKMLEFVIKYSPTEKGKKGKEAVGGLQKWFIENWNNMFDTVDGKVVELDDDLVKYMMGKKNLSPPSQIYGWLEGKKESFAKPPKGEPVLYFKKSKKGKKELEGLKLTPRDLLHRPSEEFAAAAMIAKAKIPETKGLEENMFAYLAVNDEYTEAVEKYGEATVNKAVSAILKDKLMPYYWLVEMEPEGGEKNKKLKAATNDLKKAGIVILTEKMKAEDEKKPEGKQAFAGKNVGEPVLDPKGGGLRLADWIMTSDAMKKKKEEWK